VRRCDNPHWDPIKNPPEDGRKRVHRKAGFGMSSQNFTDSLDIPRNLLIGNAPAKKQAFFGEEMVKKRCNFGLSANGAKSVDAVNTGKSGAGR
jgi:hypothetical protein